MYRSTAALLLVIFACGCTSKQEMSSVTPPDAGTLSTETEISGQWQIETKSGKILDAKIEHLQDDRYQLVVSGNFRGVYQREDDRLSMVEPAMEVMKSLVWRIDSADTMVVIEAPLQRDIGSDYTGTTLKRKSE